MLTTSAFLLPSVPTMLIDEQRGDITEMIEALGDAGARVAAESPDAIVVVAARWAGGEMFQVDDGAKHKSVVDLPGFGVEPRHDCPGAPRLARAIVEHAAARGVRAVTARRGIDSSAAVPLHFFDPARRIPVVPVSVADGGAEEHRAWGAALREALAEREERVAFVAAGALAWNVHAFNLKRELRDTLEFDDGAVGALRRGEWDALAALAKRFADRAMPEADLRHVHVLRGFLGRDVAGMVLERETLPGIGTLLAEFPLDPPAGAAGR